LSDRAEVHECVFLAVITSDEAEALHRIEELDRAGSLVAGQLALRARSLLLNRDHVANDLQIGCGNLPTAIHEVELQFLPFSKTFETRALYLADVNEHVLTTFVALDEAEALLRVEEFYLALAGTDNLGGHSAAATTAAARATTAEAIATTAA